MKNTEEAQDIPRRIRIDKMTHAELAIRSAKLAVEEAGCHVLLTEAVIMLGQAQDKVADFVDYRYRQIPPAECLHPFLMRFDYHGEVWWQCQDGCDFLFRSDAPRG